MQVYIVDSHRLVRNGLKALFADFTELEIIGTASDGEEAIEECERLQPDVILIEIMVEDGIELVKSLCEVSSSSHIVVLTYQTTRTPVLEALQAGVTGYLIKDMSADQLVDAIEKADTGSQVIAQEVVPDLVDQTTKSGPAVGEDLTNREREVLELMPEGLTNKEIAQNLTVSTATVKNHISNILAKLEADSRVEAVAIALRNQIVE
jgi:DNA-binding NarL/FixJ family response regulator